MSKNYGKFKMTTADGTVYADRVRDLVALLPDAQISAVYEFNTTTGKYRPSESAFKWLCQQRGQALPEKPQSPENENTRIVREMFGIARDMGVSGAELRSMTEGVMSRMPVREKKSLSRTAPRKSKTVSPITAARRLAGMTQAQLAEAVGVAPQQIGAWERRERNPKIDALKKIAEALDCTVDDLKNHSEE